VRAVIFDGDCGRIEVNGSRRMTFHGLDINKGQLLWSYDGEKVDMLGGYHVLLGRMLLGA
jgi:hypothetical protein